LPLLWAAALAVTACTDRRSVTDPRNLVPQQPGKEIVDGNHGGGNTDVFFLPPVVGNPSKATGYGDPFQPGLVVSFVITDLSTNAVVKTLSNVPADLTNQSYSANWNTKGTTIDISHQYRISVVVGSKNIAHADVVFGANAASLKNVDTDDFITLVDGQTLPIKVRIERGWDCLDKTSCVTAVVPTTIPAGQTVTVTTGGTLPNSVKFTSTDAGIWATNVDGSPLTVPVIVTVQDISSLHPETSGGCANGLGLTLSQNHCIQITTDPQIKLASPATVGTCLASPGDDRQLLVKYSTDPSHPEPVRFLEDAPPPSNCPPPQIGSAIHSSNPLVRFAATTLSYVGNGLNWVVGVRTAYAFDAGVGGFVPAGDGFSSFSPAFPEQMSTFTGDSQQAIQGTQVAEDLVVDLSFVHDVGEGGLSPHVLGASLTCTAVTAGASFTASHVTSIAATEIGNGKYSCGRPFVSQTPGANQFKVTANGLLDGVLFDTGNETIQLAGAATFTEQSLLSPIIGVSINPTSLNLQVGDQPILNATVALREGSEASTAVNWSLVSTTPNGVIDFKPASNVVEVIANALGTATLRATSAIDPSKFADVTVAVAPSFGGQINDPTGDGGQPPAPTPPADLVSASLTAARGNLNVVIGFAQGARVGASMATLSLDTDQNPATGHPGIASDGSRDNGIIGADYIVLVGQNFNNGQAQVLRYTGTINSFAFVGSFPVTFNGDVVSFTIPLSALGGDDGAMNFKVVSTVQLSANSFTGILDVAPNEGSAAGVTVQTVPAVIP
jgi:hypothetical protein